MKDELKKFGLIMASAFVILGVLFHLKSRLFVAAVLAFIGFLFAFFALVLPRALKSIRFVWLKFSLALGWFMSKVILAVAFYLIVTPIGLIAKIFGKHFLVLKIDKQQKSYWQQKEPEIENQPANFYERQF
ncbi:MAG: SxtJ family membrane protein [Candidatus Pacebacteria bacterium]|nr:SxtJ family membrane protein [Candidatus Paceibacterota bacterium]